MIAGPLHIPGLTRARLDALVPLEPSARLSYESGVAISLSDQTAKTTVYAVPHRGDRVRIYDGSHRASSCRRRAGRGTLA